MTTRPLPIAAVSFALACLLAAPPARAESTAAETAGSGFAPSADAAGAYGTVGQLALSLGATSGEYLSYKKSGGGWTFQLAPAADYFLFPHISLGGLVAYGHQSGGGGTGTSGISTDTFSIGAARGLRPRHQRPVRHLAARGVEARLPVRGSRVADGHVPADLRALPLPPRAALLCGRRPADRRAPLGSREHPLGPRHRPRRLALGHARGASPFSRSERSERLRRGAR